MTKTITHSFVSTLVLLFGCSTVLLANWTTAQQIATEGSQNAKYGYSIAVDSNFTAVGAPEDNNGAGAVYILKREDNGSWSPFQTIEDVILNDIDNSFVSHEFRTIGWDVALDESVSSGNHTATLVIGAPQSTRAERKFTIHGQYTQRTPESGILIYRLNSNENAFEYKKSYLGADHNDTGLAVGVAEAGVVVGYTYGPGGIPIPLFGTLTAVVAGHPNDNNVSTYINKIGTDEWHEITLNHTGAGDRFGQSLAIDSDMSHLIVGAPYQDIGEYPDKGKAYFYKLSGLWNSDNQIWSDEQPISQSTSGWLLNNCRFSVDAHFGIAVDIRDDKAIVGSEKSSTECRPSIIAPNYVAKGAAYAYSLASTTGNSWSRLGNVLTGSTINSQSDGFGLSVAIDSNRAVVGAPTKQAAFIYDFNGTSWSETQHVESGQNGTFGNDVAIKSNQIFIADEENDEFTIYEYEEPTQTNVNPALLMYLLN